MGNLIAAFHNLVENYREDRGRLVSEQKGKQKADVTSCNKENSAATEESLSQWVRLSTTTGFPGRFWDIHPLRFSKLS